MNYPDGLSEGTPGAPWNEQENYPCSGCGSPIDDEAAQVDERGWPDDLCSTCASLVAAESEHCECSDTGFCSPLHREQWERESQRYADIVRANVRMHVSDLERMRSDDPVRFHALCKDDPGALP